MKLTTLEEPLELNFVKLVPLRGTGSGCKCVAVSRTDKGIEQFVNLLNSFRNVRAPLTVECDLVPPPERFLTLLAEQNHVKNFKSLAITLLEPSPKLLKWSVVIEHGSLHMFVTARYAHELVEYFSTEADDVFRLPSADRRQLEVLGELDNESERLWII